VHPGIIQKEFSNHLVRASDAKDVHQARQSEVILAALFHLSDLLQIQLIGEFQPIKSHIGQTVIFSYRHVEFDNPNARPLRILNWPKWDKLTVDFVNQLLENIPIILIVYKKCVEKWLHDVLHNRLPFSLEKVQNRQALISEAI